MHLWHKRVSPAQADRWIGRLQSAVDPARLAVVTPATARSVRLEVYCDAKREADALAKNFGGQVRIVRDGSWQPSPATTLGHPLNIGGGLIVTGHPDELAALRAARPDRRVLCIPAAMAFGTGEHATTAMCLRFLTEIARRRCIEKWEMLDLGMGSGILALAGSAFGAGHAFGLDNDAHAVRAARGKCSLERHQRTACTICARRFVHVAAQWPDVASGGGEFIQRIAGAPDAGSNRACRCVRRRPRFVRCARQSGGRSNRLGTSGGI